MGRAYIVALQEIDFNKLSEYFDYYLNRNIYPFIGVNVPLLQVESVRVHHLGPCSDEILQEFLRCIFAAVDFRNGPKF